MDERRRDGDVKTTQNFVKCETAGRFAERIDEVRRTRRR
jgi:hypothetical protein